MMLCMQELLEQRPALLVFAGLDPTGGAGLQADIETIASLGGQALPVATATTVQDTKRVYSFTPADPALVLEQARAVLSDISVAGVKVGLVPDPAIARVVHSILEDYHQGPVVIDPVLASGGGDSLMTAGTREAVRSLLVPLATVVTPNSVEARALAPDSGNLDSAAAEMLSLGARFVLVTGTHEKSVEVENSLYGEAGYRETFVWRRLPHSYHGSGCTLASAIATLLARGVEAHAAIASAQNYTWQSLQHGYAAGTGQRIPDRFFWARRSRESWT